MERGRSGIGTLVRKRRLGGQWIRNRPREVENDPRNIISGQRTNVSDEAEILRRERNDTSRDEKE